jgi:hypothetical protein
MQLGDLENERSSVCWWGAGRLPLHPAAGGKEALWGKGRDNEWSGTDASFWRKHMENREDEVNDQIAKFICTGLRGFSFESQSPSLVYSSVLGPKFG